ncbi:hypothetical protein WJX74_004435 [Apatococcus lobatus]|uniref:Uncharacterized protein n=1 Tax=Apatococcus lobatus TaxID=904363 RepID=A0AAW1SGA7_9CHLO
MPAGSSGHSPFFTFDEAEISAAAAWALASFAGNNGQEQPNHKQELISMLKPQLVITGGFDSRVYNHAQCALHLYYRVLKKALAKLPKAQQDASTSSTACPTAWSFAADFALQLALLGCACELVSFLLVDPQQLFPAACRQLASSKLVLELWEAVQLSIQHLQDQATPAAVIQYLAFMKMQILDELAWAPGSTIYDAMLCDPQKNQQLFNQVPEVAIKGANLQAKAHRILEIVLQEQLDLFFGQHMANVLACIIYGVCKAHQVQIPLFQHIWQALRHTLPNADASVFQRAAVFSHHTSLFSQKSAPSPSTESQPTSDQPQIKSMLGDTRKLYNHTFLPSMEKHLQQVCVDGNSREQEGPSSLIKSQKDSRKAPLGTLTVHDLNTRRSGAAQ